MRIVLFCLFLTVRCSSQVLASINDLSSCRSRSLLPPGSQAGPDAFAVSFGIIRAKRDRLVPLEKGLQGSGVIQNRNVPGIGSFLGGDHADRKDLEYIQYVALIPTLLYIYSTALCCTTM